MPYRAFYGCYSTNEVVDPSNAYKIELDWAQNIVLDILRDDRDFFGLSDDRGVTLQFIRSGDTVWMEIPIPAKRGSYGRTVSIDEVRQIIKSLPDAIEVDAIPGLSFQSW